MIILSFHDKLVINVVAMMHFCFSKCIIIQMCCKFIYMYMSVCVCVCVCARVHVSGIEVCGDDRFLQ